MFENVWLGDNELTLAFICGCYRVLEKYEGWSPVYSGNYDMCLAYMYEREAEYNESLF